MKIGIVTFPEAINYGTSLQAAALKRALDPSADEVFFFRHRCAAIDASNALFDLKSARDPRYAAAHLYNFPTALARKKNFERFFARYIPVRDAAPDDVDVAVAGSDQIWNFGLTDDDRYYFLDYKKERSRKTAYAASFGLSEIDPAYHGDLRRLLTDFDAISVREKTAAKLIREICGRDVPVVVDPTLLLTEAQWAEMAAERPPEQDGIFVYTVFNSEKLWQFAGDLSKRTGLPIRTVSYSRLHRHQAEYSFTAGPAEWLSEMLRAKYVVTNSFHGFAFSVNFRKQFFFEMPPERSGVGSRLRDMAVRYGLQGRELSAADGEAPLDYTDVARLLEEDRRFSEQFIKESILGR